MANHFDQSRHLEEDDGYNPYGNAGHDRSIISNNSVEGGLKSRSVLG